MVDRERRAKIMLQARGNRKLDPYASQSRAESKADGSDFEDGQQQRGKSSGGKAPKDDMNTYFKDKEHELEKPFDQDDNDDMIGESKLLGSRGGNASSS